MQHFLNYPSADKNCQLEVKISSSTLTKIIKFQEYKEELRRDCPNTSKHEPESRLELWEFEFNCSNMCVPQQQDTSASDGCPH